MILWVLTAVILGADGDLYGTPIREYETFAECRAMADTFQEKLRTERPPEVPADTQMLCWPKLLESAKPKAKLLTERGL